MEKAKTKVLDWGSFLCGILLEKDLNSDNDNVYI